MEAIILAIALLGVILMATCVFAVFCTLFPRASAKIIERLEKLI